MHPQLQLEKKIENYSINYMIKLWN